MKINHKLFLIMGTVTITLCGCQTHQVIKDDTSKVEETEESSILDEQQIENEEKEQSNLFEFPSKIYHEEDLINSLEVMNQKIDDMKDAVKGSETVQKVVSSFKNASVKLGNFIIGRDTIGGYTFSELTDSGKEKILLLSQEIDNKLLITFPWYEGLKESLIEKYYSICNTTKDITVELIGEDNYQYFGELKDKVKQKMKNGQHYVREKMEDLLEK